MITPVLAAALSLAGCGAARQPPPEDPRDPHEPERLYPLAESHVWSYDIDTGADLPTLGIVRVERVQGDLIHMRSGEGPMLFQLRPEGIYKPETGGWLLRKPVRLGARWPAGREAVAEIVQVDASFESAAGQFADCVVVQETGAASGWQVRTTFCTDVGPVEIHSSRADRQEATTPEGETRAVGRLRGFTFEPL